MPADQLEEAVNDIEARLFNLGQSEVPSETIGEMVMQKLRELDEVAYIRFASVYRNFADLDEMIEAVEGLQGTQGTGPVDLPEKPRKKGSAQA